ncbi:MAG: hypothetical protein ACI9MJ_002332 [Alphaproteobacteria bacterium]|jgi:hypothetical protein
MKLANVRGVNGLIGFWAVLFAAVLGGSLMAAPSFAQTEAKADKSGTNPINFTNDLRLYYEYQDLTGGGDVHIGTFEGRTPALDGKLQLRVRVPFKSVDINSGPINISDSGLGDINVRVLNVPFLNPKGGTAIAVGLEAIFPTASEDILGEGKFSLGPQIFGVKFLPFGIKGSLIAPAVQQVFSVAGDDDRADVNRTQLDLFFLKQSDNKRTYVLLDPQYVFNWENDTQFGIVEAEAGYVLESGVSFYARPGFGYGGDKPFDFNFEFGTKYIF